MSPTVKKVVIYSAAVLLILVAWRYWSKKGAA